MRMTVLAFGLMAAAGPALAQESRIEVPNPAAPQASARFSLNKVDGGFLRLDTSTGQMSFCSQRYTGWTCQVVPDDRAALDAEIARLQGQIATLKTEVAKADASKDLPPRPPTDLSPQAKDAPKDGAKDEATVRLPTREEMERARAAVERAWRNLVDTISEFQKDLMRKG